MGRPLPGYRILYTGAGLCTCDKSGRVKNTIGKVHELGQFKHPPVTDYVPEGKWVFWAALAEKPQDQATPALPGRIRRGLPNKIELAVADK